MYRKLYDIDLTDNGGGSPESKATADQGIPPLMQSETTILQPEPSVQPDPQLSKKVEENEQAVIQEITGETPLSGEELQEEIASRFDLLRQELILLRGEGEWLDSFNLAAAAAQSNL